MISNVKIGKPQGKEIPSQKSLSFYWIILFE